MEVPVLNNGDYGDTEVDGCILSKAVRPNYANRGCNVT
jgi:hypothetical protein